MRKRTIVLCIIVSFAFLLKVTHAVAALQTSITFSHVANENTPKGQMALKLQELITKRLGTWLKMKVFADGKLYDDDHVLNALLLGDVQLAAPSVSKFGLYCKEMEVFDLPFLFSNTKALETFQQSPEGQELLHILNEKGLVGLGYLNDGFKVLSAIKPLTKPADAAGLRFRIQSSHVLEAQFNALGAVSMKKPFPQVSSLTKDHVIDGQENTWTNIFAQKIYKEQPYITITNHGVISSLVVTSKSFWESLDAPLQKEVANMIQEAIAYGNHLSEKYANNSQKEITTAHHANIITLSEEERRHWKDAMQPVWQQFEPKIGKKFIEAATRANQTN